MEEETNNAMSRTPDFENESFRMWNFIDEEKKSFKEFDDNDFEVEYKDLKIKLCGFNLIRETETNKIILAYKFKHKDKAFLFYIPDEQKEKFKEKLGETFKEFERISEVIGYQLINMKDKLKEMYNEKHIFDKIGKENK